MVSSGSRAQRCCARDMKSRAARTSAYACPMTYLAITYDVAKGADLNLTHGELAAARQEPTLVGEDATDRTTVHLFQEGLVAVRGNKGGRVAFVVLDPRQALGSDDSALIV